MTDLICFAHVLAAGDSLVTVSDLGARAHVTTGAVTGILNRLERGEPDPADRRRVRAVVPAAADRAQAVYGPYYARLAELFTQYTPDEIATVTDWFTRAAAVARAYLDESCAT